MVGAQSGAHCVQLLNRAAAARRATPTHRLWLRRWAPAGPDGEGWAGRGWLLPAAPDKATQSALPDASVDSSVPVPVAVFSRHARHAALAPGAWLRHRPRGDCGCAAGRGALALCGSCELEEDWTLELLPPAEEDAGSEQPQLPQGPADRVRVAPVPAATAAQEDRKSGRGSCSTRRELRLRKVCEEGAGAGLARFWRGENEAGSAVLLQGPPELALPERCAIAPAPGLFPVRAERLGGAEGALVWAGQLSAAFLVTPIES